MKTDKCKRGKVRFNSVRSIACKVKIVHTRSKHFAKCCSNIEACNKRISIESLSGYRRVSRIIGVFKY